MEGEDFQLQQHQFQDFYNPYFSFEAPLSCNVPTIQDFNSSFNNVLGESSYTANMMANIPESNEYLWSSWNNTSINSLKEMMSNFSTLNHPENCHDLLQTPSNDFFSGHYQNIPQTQQMPEAAVCPNIPKNPQAAAPIRFGRSIVHPSVIVPPSNGLSSSIVSTSMDLQIMNLFASTCHGASSSLPAHEALHLLSPTCHVESSRQTSHTDLGEQSESTTMGHGGTGELQDPLDSNSLNEGLTTNGDEESSLDRIEKGLGLVEHL